MAKWASASFLDGGLSYLKNTAVFMSLIKAYAAGDSFATVSGNIVAQSAITSADVVLSSSGSNRVATTAAKSATASANSGATPNLHIAFHDGTNVIWVTDETSDQQIYSGNPVSFPALTYTANQPT